MDNTIREHWKLFLLEGILFILLGLFAIALPNFATLSLEIFIGWLFLIGGLFQGYRVLQAHGTPGFWLSLVSPILSIIVGVLLLAYPLTGILTLTLLLATYFIVEGIAKIGVSWNLKPLKPWGWLFFSGLLSIFLGVIIFSGWPGTAIWVLGLLVGINMVFFGWALIGLSLAARSKPKAQ